MGNAQVVLIKNNHSICGFPHFVNTTAKKKERQQLASPNAVAIDYGLSKLNSLFIQRSNIIISKFERLSTFEMQNDFIR